jgi:uncharacterized RDD family membrane protein YckC
VSGDYQDKVRIRGDLVVEAGEHCEDAVVVLGNGTIAGEVHGDAVAVGGTLTISGTVHGEAVGVGGNVEVLPGAVVGKGIIAVGGRSRVAPGAQVSGQRVEIGELLGGLLPPVGTWFATCLLRGRLLAPEVPWMILLAAAVLGLALLLAVLFRSVFAEAVRLTAARPGAVVLAGVLTAAAVGPLTIALAVIVVGIVLVPPLYILLAGLGLIGLYAVLSQLGTLVLRRLFRRPAPAPLAAGLVGSALLLALAMVPYVGLAVVAIAKLLGIGAGVFAFLTLARAPGNGHAAGPAADRPNAASLAAGAAAPATAAATTAGTADLGLPADADPGFRAVPTPVPFAVPAPAGPVLAGLWERLGAALIDFILVAVVFSIAVSPVLEALASHDLDEPGRLRFSLLLVYLAAMWAWRQTTVGNTVFHLRVQRTDGTRITVGIALVRALTLVLSVVPLGLGFWWLRWDPRRQAWHDKVAGTEVLKMPAGVPLL